MIFQNILDILKEKNIKYDLIEHEESKSCEHSKELREKAGLTGVGSKNIVFHAKGNFYLVTTLGDKDIKARKFKGEFGTKDIRFASQDEITIIKLGTIGSISPFGFQNDNIKIYVDAEIFEHEYFMFNPGVGTKTIRLKTSDLIEIYKSLKNEVKIFYIGEEEIEISELQK